MSVPARRRQVGYGRERGLSVRRACTLFSVARSALRYQSRKTLKDAGVIERMQELSAQYPRYGYRRIRIFLGRDGHRMSVGRAYRSGARPPCSCHARGHASAWQHGRARKRPRGRTKCGRMILYSTIAPTGSSSSASPSPTSSPRRGWRSTSTLAFARRASSTCCRAL